ncbi:MAG: hypothetical protein AAFO96_03625 [Bacteroidota bacterium]
MRFITNGLGEIYNLENCSQIFLQKADEEPISINLLTAQDVDGDRNVYSQLVSDKVNLVVLFPDRKDPVVFDAVSALKALDYSTDFRAKLFSGYELFPSGDFTLLAEKPAPPEANLDQEIADANMRKYKADMEFYELTQERERPLFNLKVLLNGSQLLHPEVKKYQTAPTPPKPTFWQKLIGKLPIHDWTEPTYLDLVTFVEKNKIPHQEIHLKGLEFYQVFQILEQFQTFYGWENPLRNKKDCLELLNTFTEWQINVVKEQAERRSTFIDKFYKEFEESIQQQHDKPQGKSTRHQRRAAERKMNKVNKVKK